MKPVYLIISALLSLNAAAQTDSATVIRNTTTIGTDSTVSAAALAPVMKPVKRKADYPKNVVKFNIGSLVLFKNYNFTLERALTRKISASLGYRTMGTTALTELSALKNTYKLIGEDENTLKEDFGGIKASNKTATLDFRFYGGSKPGPRGFYFGVYGRYAKFDIDYAYEYETDARTYAIPIKTTAKGVGGGAYIGVQWLIGKRVALDWQILGGQWGKLTGDGSGAADLSALTEAEKTDLKYDLEDKVPALGDKNIITANVSNTGANVKVDGPFAGLRSGISIGISF